MGFLAGIAPLVLVAVVALGVGEAPSFSDRDCDGGATCRTLPGLELSDTSAPAQAEPGKSARGIRQRGRVVRVVDGDTVTVRLASRRLVTVRMIGIDTPEVHGDVECGGKAASRWLTKRLPGGTRVRLVSDPTQARRDVYGRVLRYVVRASNGRDINRAQVHAGNATVYVYNDVEFERVSSYRRAQTRARAAGRGVWGRC